MYDLNAVIEANTVDEVVDFEKVMESLNNDYVNPIVAKKTDKEKLSKEAVSTLVKELGIDGDGIDAVKLYIKQMGGNTDEVKEANVSLTLQLKELQTNYDTEVETRTNLENKTKTENQITKIKALGDLDDDQVEFLSYKFNKLVTDDKDFDTVVAEYAKEKNVKTTTKFIKDDFSSPKGSVDIGEVWREKNKARTK